MLFLIEVLMIVVDKFLANLAIDNCINVSE